MQEKFGLLANHGDSRLDRAVNTWEATRGFGDVDWNHTILTGRSLGFAHSIELSLCAELYSAV